MNRWLALLLLVPSPVWACATCVDPKDARQANFLLPTIFMSLLPITMFAVIGGLFWWAHKRSATPEDASVTTFPEGVSPPA